jgi:hypothetical protein
VFLRRKTFAQRKNYAWETFSRGNLSKQTACTQRNSYTEKFSQTETLTHGKLLHKYYFPHSTHLHRDDFAHSRLLCTESFYTKTFLTHKLLHTDFFFRIETFRQRFLVHTNFLHTTNSHKKNAHSKLLDKEPFYAEKLSHKETLHTETLTFYTETLLYTCVYVVLCI